MSFPGLPELGGDQVERLVPRGLAEALGGALQRVVVADERGGQAVLAVQDLCQVVAFHTAQTAVGAVLRVAHNGGDHAVLDVGEDAAPSSAETADALVNTISGGLARVGQGRPGASLPNDRRHGARCGGDCKCDGGALDEIPSRKLHEMSPFSSLFCSLGRSLSTETYKEKLPSGVADVNEVSQIAPVARLGVASRLVFPYIGAQGQREGRARRVRP